MPDIYFHLKENINKKSFEMFIKNQFGFSSIQWVNDIIDYFSSNTLNENTALITENISNAGFKYHYNLYGNRVKYKMSLREEVEVLKELSNKLNIEILTSDDEIDPFTYILIEPNCQATTIDIADDPEELILEGYYNFELGSFMIHRKLIEKELKALNEIIKELYNVFKITYSQEPNTILNIKRFCHRYVIKPEGKNNWISIEEKSEKFTEMMIRFQKEIKEEICIFPKNYMKIVNIDGGSDSEEHCLIIDQDKIEKIIYKYPRKSWLNV